MNTLPSRPWHSPLSEKQVEAFHAVQNIPDSYDWQKKIVEQALIGLSHMVFSLPTGSGKTYVAEMAILHCVLVQKRTALYVVPYVSLAEERMASFRKVLAHPAFAGSFQLELFAGSQGRCVFSWRLCRRPASHTMLPLTPAPSLPPLLIVATFERAVSIINWVSEEDHSWPISPLLAMPQTPAQRRRRTPTASGARPLDVLQRNAPGVIVVDEVHMLGSGTRGLALELLFVRIVLLERRLHGLRVASAHFGGAPPCCHCSLAAASSFVNLAIDSSPYAAALSACSSTERGAPPSRFLHCAGCTAGPPCAAPPWLAELPPPIPILAMSATIPNLSQIGRWLARAGTWGMPCDAATGAVPMWRVFEYSRTERPIPLLAHVVDGKTGLIARVLDDAPPPSFLPATDCGGVGGGSTGGRSLVGAVEALFAGAAAAPAIAPPVASLPSSNAVVASLPPAPAVHGCGVGAATATPCGAAGVTEASSASPSPPIGITNEGFLHGALFGKVCQLPSAARVATAGTAPAGRGGGRAKSAQRVVDGDHVGALVAPYYVANKGVLVFCSTKNGCDEVARSLASLLAPLLPDRVRAARRDAPASAPVRIATGAPRPAAPVDPLAAAVATTLVDLRSVVGGASRTSLDLLESGIAVHHAGLGTEERRLLERAYKERVLCVLCCTSTLAAGVNLPARAVIVREPRLGCGDLSVSSFTQMIGRAGRPGFDRVGEAFLLLPRCDAKERDVANKLIAHNRGASGASERTVSPLHTLALSDSAPLVEKLLMDAFAGGWGHAVRPVAWVTALSATTFAYRQSVDRRDSPDTSVRGGDLAVPLRAAPATSAPHVSEGAAYLEAACRAVHTINLEASLGAGRGRQQQRVVVPPRLGVARPAAVVPLEEGSDPAPLAVLFHQAAVRLLDHGFTKSYEIPLRTLQQLREGQCEGARGEGTPSLSARGAEILCCATCHEKAHPPSSGTADGADPCDSDGGARIRDEPLIIDALGVHEALPAVPAALTQRAAGLARGSGEDNGHALELTPRQTLGLPPPPFALTQRRAACGTGMTAGLAVAERDGDYAGCKAPAGDGRGGAPVERVLWGAPVSELGPAVVAPLPDSRLDDGDDIGSCAPTEVCVFMHVSRLGAASARGGLDIQEAAQVANDLGDAWRITLPEHDELHLVYLVTPVRGPTSPVDWEALWELHDKQLAREDRRDFVTRLNLSDGFWMARSRGERWQDPVSDVLDCRDVLRDAAVPQQQKGGSGGSRGWVGASAASSSRKRCRSPSAGGCPRPPPPSESCGELRVGPSAPSSSSSCIGSEKRAIRFRWAMILHDLLKEVDPAIIMRTYRVTKADLDQLLTTAHSFASHVVAVADALDLWGIAALLSIFVKRLVGGSQADVIALTVIKGIGSARARLLVRSGYTAVSDVAKAHPEALWAVLKGAAPSGVSERAVGDIISSAREVLGDKVSRYKVKLALAEGCLAIPPPPADEEGGGCVPVPSPRHLASTSTVGMSGATAVPPASCGLPLAGLARTRSDTSNPSLVPRGGGAPPPCSGKVPIRPPPRTRVAVSGLHPPPCARPGAPSHDQQRRCDDASLPAATAVPAAPPASPPSTVVAIRRRSRGTPAAAPSSARPMGPRVAGNADVCSATAGVLAPLDTHPLPSPRGPSVPSMPAPSSPGGGRALSPKAMVRSDTVRWPHPASAARYIGGGGPVAVASLHMCPSGLSIATSDVSALTAPCPPGSLPLPIDSVSSTGVMTNIQLPPVRVQRVGSEDDYWRSKRQQ